MTFFYEAVSLGSNLVTCAELNAWRALCQYIHFFYFWQLCLVKCTIKQTSLSDSTSFIWIYLSSFLFSYWQWSVTFQVSLSPSCKWAAKCPRIRKESFCYKTRKTSSQSDCIHSWYSFYSTTSPLIRTSDSSWNDRTSRHSHFFILTMMYTKILNKSYPLS